MTFPTRLRWLILTFVVVILDRCTKMRVETPDTPIGWRHEVIRNFIYIVHSVNPGIANEFSTGAFRFGHSLLGDDVEFLDNNGDETQPAIPLASLGAFDAYSVMTSMMSSLGVSK